MREMRDNPRRGMDPVVVKAFINLTGIYPVGTLVVLDTFELGLVHSVNPLPEMLSRPIPDGVFLRTIIKTENPDRYGIRVGDYFV
jgi:hypothetical protein